MKIKFNWGTGIVVFIGIFMVFILLLVAKCTQQNIDLVSENYYDKELHFQDQIDRIENSIKVESKVKIVQDGSELIIQFPPNFIGSTIVGNILFFKPDNSMLDFEIPIGVLVNNSKFISTAKLKRGSWKVSINYTTNNTNFYYEEKLLIKNSKLKSTQ